MNILFHFVSLPHLSKDGALFAALINEFAKKGHSVYVTTKGESGKRT